ncbi:MAG TPA: efflux RND transporter periplasmic adaptor subunit [Candidatus Acidoferrales bacterium]|nr:efflux RND transporter periplasmic adaptor subunit [Candidatus Acidoferrales bacterium]
MATLDAALKGRRTWRQLLPAALGVVAIGWAALIGHQIIFPPSPTAAIIRTVSAQVGTVHSVVSGTGNLAPANQENVDFGVPGTVDEIDAAVGTSVVAGQVLAKLDPTDLQLALTQAQNQLTLANQQLGSSGASIANDQATLSADRSSVSADNNQLGADTNQYNLDWGAYNANALYASDASSLRSAQSTYQANLALARQQGCVSNPGSTVCQAMMATLRSDDNAQTSAQQLVNGDLATVTADQARMGADRSRIGADQSKLSADQLRVDADSTLPQQNAVLTAQQQVKTATANLAKASLTAPIAGVVLAVNGSLGQSVSGAATAASSAAAGGTAGTGSAASGSSGTGFMEIGDLSALQVVAPFVETDASRVLAGQTASVTFDAVSGLTIPGQVAAVAPLSTVTSGVVNYSVTIALNGSDPRLRDGMTSNVSVTVVNTPDVLVAPNSAISTIGTASYVTVLGRDGKTKTRTRVELGAVGDTTTQVTSGLSSGARLVLPSLALTTGGTGARGAGRGGVLGGLGGGGGLGVGSGGGGGGGG